MPAMQRSPFLLCVVGAVLLSAAGCGESSTTETVSGTVTYRGAPLPNGSVTFFPTSGRPVNVPRASDGAYTAELEPGEYSVTVSYTEPLPPGFKEGDPVPPPKIVLPAEYTTSARSTLKATVTPDHDQPIDFTLE
jgi:hypothetical protein